MAQTLLARNPDQALIHRFARDGAETLRIDSNPVAADLGCVLHAFDAQAQTIALHFTAEGRHLQGNGAVQGGMVATMLDFALAFVVLGALEAPAVAVTVSMNLEFQKAVLPGELLARAWVNRLGSRMAFASAALTKPDDALEVFARASAVMAVNR